MAGVERKSKKLFAVSLGRAHRDNRKVVESVITKRIKPGSIIITRDTYTYYNVTNLEDEKGVCLNYQHATILYENEFPNIKVSVRTIQGYLTEFKWIINFTSSEDDITEEDLFLHLYKYLFYKKHKNRSHHHLMLGVGKLVKLGRNPHQ